jgi:hypothetical protein
MQIIFRAHVVRKPTPCSERRAHEPGPARAPPRRRSVNIFHPEPQILQEIRGRLIPIIFFHIHESFTTNSLCVAREFGTQPAITFPDHRSMENSIYTSQPTKFDLRAALRELPAIDN